MSTKTKELEANTAVDDALEVNHRNSKQEMLKTMLESIETMDENEFLLEQSSRSMITRLMGAIYNCHEETARTVMRRYRRRGDFNQAVYYDEIQDEINKEKQFGKSQRQRNVTSSRLRELVYTM